MEELGRIKPKSVEIYSINREFPGSGIEMVPMALLEALANKTETETGLPVTVFGNWE